MCISPPPPPLLPPPLLGRLMSGAAPSDPPVESVGRDAVLLSVDRRVVPVARLFTSLPAEPLLGCIIPWIVARQLAGLANLTHQTIKRLLTAASKVSSHVSRWASPADLVYLRDSGIIFPSARAAMLVTVTHAIVALRPRVSAALIGELECLARRRIRTDQPAERVRTLVSHSRQRLRLMPVGDAPRVLHDSVPASGLFGLSAADLLRWHAVASELDALRVFCGTRINDFRIGPASSAQTVENLVGAARSYLGFVRHGFPRGGRCPSLEDYFNGVIFRAYLDYLGARAEARLRATSACTPGTYTVVSNAVQRCLRPWGRGALCLSENPRPAGSHAPFC